MTLAVFSALLAPEDPEPVDLINPDSRNPVLLLCEHAGQAIPGVLDGLGVSQALIDSHRGWDIGAENVARRLAEKLNAPLILQRYSRLVIDANRPPRGEGSMLQSIDGIAIPGNQMVPTWQREARINEIFEPLERAIASQFARHPRRCAISIHSFTPQLAGRSRPWHAGFLTRTKTEFAERLMTAVQGHAPAAVLALNEPYQIGDETDWFIPVHAEPRDIPHCLIEIRNNLVANDAGAEEWAGFLAGAISGLLEEIS